MSRPKCPPASATPAARAAGSPPEPDESPFADTPDATLADCETRPRTWGVPAVPEVRGAEWVAKARKPRAKRVDLNPVQRRWFSANGWTFARVEVANGFGAVTVDLWGFADYLAVKPGEGVMLVQTCSAQGRSGDPSKRLKKAQAAPELAVWLAAGGRFEVHAWRQRGGPGSRWELERRAVTATENV